MSTGDAGRRPMSDGDGPQPPASPAPAAPAEDVEELDPAYFRERTELAWVRTALSFAGVGAATLKSVPVAGVLMLAIAVGVWLVGHFSRPYGPPDVRVRGLRLRLVAFAITAVALIALATALFGVHAPGPVSPGTG